MLSELYPHAANESDTFSNNSWDHNLEALKNNFGREIICVLFGKKKKKKKKPKVAKCVAYLQMHRFYFSKSAVYFYISATKCHVEILEPWAFLGHTQCTHMAGGLDVQDLRPPPQPSPTDGSKGLLGHKQCFLCTRVWDMANGRHRYGRTSHWSCHCTASGHLFISF